ncbi:beta-N-acetylhexosaminidase [Pedobacter sp. MW01-1-1]|uniref:beta-N-acetylhexosaminidase n=1 Tax=Pedobacter sp. MW01-1-1 TaxID=3383027 RepID=UPI003FEDCF81
MKKYFVYFVCACSFLTASAQSTLQIIPKPTTAAVGDGFFSLNKKTAIKYSYEPFKEVVNYFRAEIAKQNKLSLKSGKADQCIEVVQRTDNFLSDEAYRLVIKNSVITLDAPDAKGAFYGFITLLQLAKSAQNNQIQVCEISDAPAYKWRGFMLDESRHFFGKEKVKELLNWMAFYKLNKFHWHLTDEPAWRLAIKKYPKLAKIGGKGDFLDPNLPAQYYSQADIKELVAYAAERQIEVIPEIDMPGHATAANRAYPEFSGGGSDAHPEFTFNPGYEGTYSYLTNILREVAALFPSKLIHIGGDEVGFGNVKWKTDSGIVKFRTQKNLKDEVELEHYFMRRMADSVYRLNAKVLGWHELADANVPTDNTLLMWWRQEKPEELRTALKKGYETVICPRIPLYFDFVQDSTHQSGRRWGKDFSPLEKIYAFDAKSYALNAAEEKLIVGIQANLWTETVDTEQRLDFMVFPRMAALSEGAWTSQSNKSYPGFKQALQQHFQWYKQQGLSYFNPFAVTETPEIKQQKKKQ